MKKALFFTLLTSLAFFAQAQIGLAYNGTALNDGDTIYLTTNDREVEFQPTIINSGSTDRVCIMKGNWVSQPADVVVSMCAGVHCNTGLISSAFTVEANSEYGDGHVEFYFPTGSTTCLMKFTVYDTISTAVRSNVYLYIDAPVGIEETAETSSMRAFPNPASSMVTISYELDNADGAIVLYNMDGAKVSETPVSGTEGRATIDVSGLPAGLYMYGVRDGKRLSCMRKLIVK